MDIEKRLAEIDEGDPEEAHILEDALVLDLLRAAIGEGVSRIADIRRFLAWYDDPAVQRTRWYA